MRDALFLEDAPAALLRAEPVERRDVPRRSAAGARSQVASHRAVMQNGRTSATSGSPTSERIRRTAPGRASSFIASGSLRPSTSETGKNRARASARVELGDEAEVVVEHARVDGLGGHVDDPRARRAQQAQHEAEKPLLVGREDRDQLVGNVHADRVDDDDRSLTSPIERRVTEGQTSLSRSCSAGEDRVVHPTRLDQARLASRGRYAGSVTTFDDLYRENILDHYKNPRNHGEIEGADAYAEGMNPLCGDEVSIFVSSPTTARRSRMRSSPAAAARSRRPRRRC